MTNLIHRLEAAEGPSRELDAQIDLAIRHPDYRFPEEVLNRKPADYQEALGRLEHDGFGGGRIAPPYTASLDAARSLSNWILVYASDIGADGLAYVRLGNPQDPTDLANGVHSHLPIAWCIAALVAHRKERSS